jgi:putative flippase GtrA
MLTLNEVQRQFLRYASIGVASNVLCYVIYLGLTRLGLGPKLAMTLLYVVGLLQTFVFNKRWTFQHVGAHRKVFFRYCAAYGFGYVINIGALFILVDLCGFPHQLVQGVMILSLAVMLFLIQKYWVFGPATGGQGKLS